MSDSCISGRIVEWNEARYKQINCKSLTLELLVEEVREFGSAEAEVDELDALIDIIYVATGGMWKMGLNLSQIIQAIHVVCDSNDSKACKKTESFVKANIDKGKNFIRPEPRLQEILDERPKKSSD